MQNVLNIKERMETQAKTEYAQMLGALHDEEVKMHNIMSTLNSYKVQASQLSIGKLDIAKIRRCNEAIKITIAKYHTPNDRVIDGIGIKPDVEIALPDGTRTKGTLEDVQVQKAFDILNQE